MSQQPEQSGGSTAKWLAIMVVMIAVIIIGIWIYKWITWIIYGFIDIDTVDIYCQYIVAVNILQYIDIKIIIVIF